MSDYEILECLVINESIKIKGHLYDKDGNQMEWLSAMAQAYDKRAKCFVDQYNGYSIIKGENYTIEVKVLR